MEPGKSGSHNISPRNDVSLVLDLISGRLDTPIEQLGRFKVPVRLLFADG